MASQDVDPLKSKYMTDEEKNWGTQSDTLVDIIAALIMTGKKECYWLTCYPYLYSPQNIISFYAENKTIMISFISYQHRILKRFEEENKKCPFDSIQGSLSALTVDLFVYAIELQYSIEMHFIVVENSLSIYEFWVLL